MRSLHLLSILLLLFTSCSGDAQTGDFAPTEPVDLSSIQEPQPQHITPTKAGNRSPYEVNGKTYTLLPSAEGYVETGLASWYGMKFQGRTTSCGESFDAYQLTAAHKTLPIPCFARITHTTNGNSIIVRINDRGPFIEDRIVDLSWAAAAKLGMVEEGISEVVVEVIQPL